MATEAELNALKKLESNKTCVNCDTYNKFGHGNVCEKYKTFVCSHCKSAHQSFSMRVKSVTMSNWSKEEVDALKEANGGGNAVAKRVWLGLYDESKLRKPHENDHLDVFKRFIDKVYNDKLFYDEDAARNASSSGGSSNSPSKKNTDTSQRTAPAAPAANLLDFGGSSTPSFDAFGSSPPTSGSGSDGWDAFTSAAPAPVSTTNNGFSNDGFGALMAAPAPVAVAPARTAQANTFDPFAPSSGAATPVQPTNTPVFDPFAPSSSSNGGRFDPFAAPSNQGYQQQYQAPKPAVMAPPPSSNFNAFDALAGPSPGMMGMGMGGPRMGMGMPNGNTGMGMGQPNNMGMMNSGMSMVMGIGMGNAPRPMMPTPGGGAAISSFMMPTSQQPGYGGRPGVPGGRDPFAGIGLPGK